jgi:putative transposase
MLSIILHAIGTVFRGRHALALENLALRQQLGVLQRNTRTPRLKRWDRGFWVLISRIWKDWQRPLSIVQPDTVIRWHRQGFRLYWRRKSKPGRPGRPKVTMEIRALIRRMRHANPTWGAPRIHGELVKLGIDIGEASVSKYMGFPRKPPSQTWHTFLRNHATDIVSIDFFTVPTATFRVLFVFLVLGNERRRVLHFNVTDSPSAIWTGQQIVEAFPWETAPRFLIRDRDKIFGNNFVHRVGSMGIEQILTSTRSPWQNPYVERVIGSIRRECLDHMIVLNEKHLQRILASYFRYYHGSRTHLGLGKDCPLPRRIEPPDLGSVCEESMVGGLHHRYFRQAA